MHGVSSGNLSLHPTMERSTVRSVERAQLCNAARIHEFYTVDGPACRASGVTASPAPPRPAAASVDYRLLGSALHECKRSPDLSARTEFLEFYGAYAAPALHQEEVALQYMTTRLAGLYLRVGDTIPMCITENLRQTPVRDYASSYQVSDLINDNTHGCFAYRLEPQDGDMAAWAMVLFVGTANTRVGDVLALEHCPTGLRADLDPMGIGRTAFEAQAPALVEWVTSSQRQGRTVHIVGHSLGGAMAMRLLARLTPEQQQQARLFHFCAPGIEPEEVAKIVPGLHNVRYARYAWPQGCDIVPGFGEAFPPGERFTIHGWDGCEIRRRVAPRHGGLGGTGTR